MKQSSPEAIRLLHDGAIMLSHMEQAGVGINLEYLDDTIEKTKGQISSLLSDMKRDDIYKVWHRRFGTGTNIGSRSQLATILYDVMGYAPKQRTAGRDGLGGRGQVNKDALDEIDLPFVQNFIRLEEHKHVLTTYLNGIKREMVEHGGHWFVHCNYNLHTACTYRSSCDGINFQNNPKRNREMMELVRPCFNPHNGHHMVEIDFSQLEIRGGACHHKDPMMITYIMDKSTDMHRDMAKEIFILDDALYEKHKDEFKKTARDSAKNQFVFPQTYGSVYFNCAKNIWKSMSRRKFMCGKKTMQEHLAKHGITELGDCIGGQDAVKGTFEQHLKEVERKMWHKRFPKYTQWKERWWRQYQSEAGFTMLSGFRVNGVFDKNDVLNYPIQGSSFHCLLWCLIRIDNWLRKNKMKTRLIGEIHDSIVASVNPRELQDFLSYCHKVMTVDLPKAWPWIIVPLETESEVGPVDGHWMTVTQWTEQNGKWSSKT